MEWAWIVPIAIPFIIGFLVGIIIKKTIKLALIILALVLILGAVGYIMLPSVQDVMQKAIEYLPKIWEAGSLLNLLPYSTITFLVGLALGLWKG
ncbi:MAG: hypothetical protein L6N96_07020 [Candidatus Methylarchaceae archaeon HK02M2]|nr:hypothetical protein [Candidatus Methylarchaceae archaeon HK02M2]